MEEWLSIEEILRILASEGIEVSRRTFLYYVQLGLLPKGKRVGQRSGGVKFFYPKEALERLRKIWELKNKGFKLKEIKFLLGEPDSEEETEETFPRAWFPKEVERCTGCGACGGVCPVYEEMDVPPRVLIQWVINGSLDRAEEVNTPLMCVRCYLCEERCPEGVPVVSFLFALRKRMLREKNFRVSPVSEWSRLFWELIEERGRSFDFGAVHAYQIRLVSSSGQRKLVLRVPLSEGRIEVSPPPPISNIRGFRRVLRRAKELS